MNGLVLDASVILSLIKREPRAERLLAAMEPGVVPAVSAVNMAEVVGKLALTGAPEARIREAIRLIPMEVVPFGDEQAYVAGLMRPLTETLGLSAGDRACLALAQSLGAVAVTTDRPMGQASVGVEIRVIR